MAVREIEFAADVLEVSGTIFALGFVEQHRPLHKHFSLRRHEAALLRLASFMNL